MRQLPLRVAATLIATTLSPVRAHAQEGLEERLQPTLSQLASWDRDDSPGGVVAVLRRGELEFVHSFGRADLAAGLANAEDVPFYLASLAKPFTAASAWAAARSGELDLDASVRELIPELPESYAPVRWRELIHHVSGVPDVYDTAIAANLPSEVLSSNAAALELLARIPALSFPPGDRFLYSNSGYVLLAEGIERASGTDFAAFARAQVFTPLGMEGARFGSDEHGDAPIAATSYERVDGGWRPKSIPTGLRGPGGMTASLLDLARFERAWWHDELGSIGPRAALLDAPGAACHPSLGTYAVGWIVSSMRGFRTERHFGGAFGFSSDLLRLPELGWTVIALSNAADLNAKDVAEAIAASLLPPTPADANRDDPEAVTLSEEQLAQFGRIWRAREGGHCWILTTRPTGFVLATLGDTKLQLVPTSERRLEAVGSEQPFTLELGERELVARTGERVVATLGPLAPPVAPSADYAGTFVHAGLGSEIRFAPGPGGTLELVQERPILELPPFFAVGADTFLCDRGAQVDFVRDGSGEITGCVVHANRAWGLEFERTGGAGR